MKTLLSNGKLADTFQLTPEDVTIDILSHGLANINRYSGHTLHPYSVAQHSLVLTQICEPGLEKAALLHDAAEMFIGDIPYPMKKALGEAYDEIEEDLNCQIFDIWGVPYSLMMELEDLDRQVCINEMRDFFPEGSVDYADAIPNLRILPINWYEAKHQYYHTFKRHFLAH